MIGIAICDDDIKSTEYIESLILNSPLYNQEKLIISIFYSGESFTKAVQPSCPFDLIFMDIEMSGMNGIQAGHVLREDYDNDPVQLIYISCYEQYHVQLFEVRPSGFIKKPIQKEAFEQKLQSAIHRIQRLRTHQKPRQLIIQKKGVEALIPTRNIMYLASDRRKIILHTVEETTEYYSTLSEEENKLPVEQFIRIHQSYLVNFCFVKQISARKVILCNGEELPVSEKHNATLHKKYFNFRRSLLESAHS
ncbi:DNA-binding response regulator [Paenibacillus albidus]|uniref:DNA-binding response regulator n=1 Tax=Paenibacillus albidus TaxID=2041023 RepID=A0A917CY08_9BACL|nr:LytTR family DNA-binding domain-containing protein [Paenibacillus albidus]GGG01554.1 DNA-binding response regulator [Paenibacillus albidus]